MLTPLRIFLNCFSNALKLRLARRFPFLVITSVPLLCKAAHKWSLEQLVAVPGSLLTSRQALHSGTRSSSIHPRLESMYFGRLQVTSRTAALGEEGHGGDSGMERAQAQTSGGARLGARLLVQRLASCLLRRRLRRPLRGWAAAHQVQRLARWIPRHRLRRGLQRRGQ